MGLFEESYKQLNDAQRQAVDTIDGPVLVVAGPGTGKTQLLSMRVANILRKTDTDASNILCLTFTNKAALNMRERLMRLAGNEAQHVLVRTFHSFAAEVMNMYPDYFWNGARLTTAPDTTQLDIIKTILSELPLNNPLALKFAGNFTAGKDVKDALKYAKEAGLTPEKLHALTTANLAYIDTIEDQLVDILSAPLSAKKLPRLLEQIEQLPGQGISNNLQPLQDLREVIVDSLRFAILQDTDSGKTKNTGKWKQRWVQSVEGKKGMYKERERNLWWQSLAGVYESYRQQLHARGYYDYSDMIVEVIAQLQKHPDMLADARERFNYILVDEFQDTNAAQLQLANLIAGDADSSPNIMAVGDDDQSIYKFNGAELNNMLSFRHSYKDTKLIVLTDNYRSSQAILDTSTAIISQVQDRLTTRVPDLSKQLVAKNPPKSSSNIDHYSYDTEEFELSELARRIAGEHNQQDQTVAVLARDHQSLQRLAALLTSLRVPVSYEQQNNILDHPAVQQIYMLCQIIVSIQDGNKSSTNILLSKLLPGKMWGIEPAELWQLALASNKANNWLDNCLASSDPKLQDVGKWLLWLAKEASEEPLLVVIEYVIGLRTGDYLTSPLREYYLGSKAKKIIDNEYLRALSAIRLLLSLATDFSARSSASLADFVSFIRASMDSGEIIADESVYVSGDNPVHLLTVHKAKGLEFDVVHIVNAIDASWKPSSGGRKCPANLPLQPAGDDQDDYTRLMYVAATRAKRDLHIHSYKQDVNGKDVLAVPMLSDVMTLHDVSSTIDPITVLEEHLVWPRLNSTDQKRNLQPRLDGFELSASSLLDFLNLSKGGPDMFLERHLLHLPSVKSTSLSFGTAMHSALEYAQVATNGSGMSTEAVRKVFQDALHNQQLSPSEESRFAEHGQEILTKLLASETFWLAKGDLPEQEVSGVVLGQAKLKGKIDRIHQTKDELLVIDYKTGKPLSSFTTRDQTKAITAWKQRTQLTFYALLLQRSRRFPAQNIVGQIWYLEASSPKELVREFIPSKQDIQDLEQLIAVVWDKITTLNLPDVSNYGSDYAAIQQFIADLVSGQI